jgi:NAD(P)-dependent dehydrogenase (short-subunit alcohol dehydrogenase family)
MTPASAKRRLEGKIAIVTGAGRGIGRAEALLFAAQGAKVVVNDLGGGPTGSGGDSSIAEAVVAEIRAAGGVAVADTHNVSSWQGGAAVIGTALEHFGRIDILSNNAGIVRPNRIDAMTEADLDLVVAVNLKGYVATVRHAAPHFIQQRSGTIINKGSPAGFGQYGMSNYGAAKAAVAGFTRSIARDLGEFGVRANVVIPISFQTTMGIPEVTRMGSYSRERYHNVGIWNRSMLPGNNIHPGPEHVAALTVWLATDATSEVNGREFFISGSEVGLMPEPELQRATFEPKGWTLDDFDNPGNRQYLIGNVRNPFC